MLWGGSLRFDKTWLSCWMNCPFKHAVITTLYSTHGRHYNPATWTITTENKPHPLFLPLFYRYLSQCCVLVWFNGTLSGTWHIGSPHKKHTYAVISKRRLWLGRLQCRESGVIVLCGFLYWSADESRLCVWEDISHLSCSPQATSTHTHTHKHRLSPVEQCCPL